MGAASSGNLLIRNHIRVSHSILLCALMLQLGKPLSGQAISADQCTSRKAQSTIDAGDLLHVSVYRVPELEQHVRVSDKGDVKLYLAGDVHVSGKTPEAVSDLIAGALRMGGFVRDAHVNTLLEGYGYEYVSVRGEVLHPGSYRLTRETDLLEIISLAGGLAQFADTHIAIRPRGSLGDPICVVFDNENKAAIADRVMVYPGDSIVVKRAATAFVLGDVKRPGGILLPTAGMTASRAIASASDLDSLGKNQQVRLVKLTANGPVESILDIQAIGQGKQNDPELSPEDIIYVSFAKPGKLIPDARGIVAIARSNRIKAVLQDEGTQ